MNSVVVLHPASDQCKGACGIGYRAYPDVIAFERFDEGLCHAVALRTLDWGKARFEVQGQGDVDRLAAAKIDPLSVSHCTLCGARLPPKRRSTHWTIISRIISPEIPAVVASQAMTSRSWQSRTKAMRTISPFQQVNSKASAHQRMFERMVMILPSCSRARRRPVSGCSSSPCFFIRRKMRLALTGSRPADRRSRLRSAAIRL